MLLTFGCVYAAILARIQERLANGYYTERWLARQCSVSQPHMHNVLCGKRALRPHLADRLLAVLGLPLAQLVSELGLEEGASRSD